MARRMFSPVIIGSDTFLDMPTSSRELYFQLGMYADDDGFVNPKRIMRMIGASGDDLKVLASKNFVIPFESGVVVITNWKVNNLVRKDWYRKTIYLKEKSSLFEDEIGNYSLVNEMLTDSLTERQRRLGKDRLGKDTNTHASDVPSQDIVSVIDSFKEVNPSYGKWYGNKTQRSAITRMISIHGVPRLLEVIRILPQSNKIPYVPTITTPLQLEEKWAALESSLIKKKNELISAPKGRGLA